MSEPQEQYDTDTTDAQPTPGPWRLGSDGVMQSDDDITIQTEEGWPDCTIASVNTAVGDSEYLRDEIDGHWRANARLIAAAGTSAHEAKEMGYDPQAAVETLPKLLRACEDAADGKPVYSKAAQDALAAARGGGDE